MLCIFISSMTVFVIFFLTWEGLGTVYIAKIKSIYVERTVKQQPTDVVTLDKCQWMLVMTNFECLLLTP